MHRLQKQTGFIANNCLPSLTEDGVARLVFTSLNGTKLFSTGHGAVTPNVIVRDWLRKGRCTELCLPVMEDFTGMIYQVTMLAVRPNHLSAASPTLEP
jgi:hypothetical protein